MYILFQHARCVSLENCCHKLPTLSESLVYDQICKLKICTRPSEKSDNFELLDFLLNLAKGRRKFDFYLSYLVWYNV